MIQVICMTCGVKGVVKKCLHTESAARFIACLCLTTFSKKDELHFFVLHYIL